MNALFAKDGLRILEALTFTDTLYAFDFDGTLAPIVEVPSEARMRPTTARLLESLSRVACTAIISGRSLADLRPRVPEQVRYLVGNHGLEGLPNATAVSELRAQCAEWKGQLGGLLGEEIGADPGVWVEDKEFSLSVHYRKSRKKKAARAAIEAALGRLDPAPRIIPGKFVFNVAPQGGPHKGAALNRLVNHSGRKFAFYIGDDDTDEDVFSLPGEGVMTVRVGNSRASGAQYYIPGQERIDDVLRRLVEHHGGKG